MRYHITHTTEYTYSQFVQLTPHNLRLCPRADQTQRLLAFELSCAPVPTGHSDVIDLDGNACTRIWFQTPTAILKLMTKSTVETQRKNPFDFLLEPWAMQLPLDYPATLQQQLHPYLQGSLPGQQLDPIAVQLAQAIWQETAGNPVSFLSTLTQRIQQDCQYIVREEGAPLPPGLTWQQKKGSCRDFTVLFMEVCRAINLAARFVSGYQEGDPDQTERHLHAWAEVYLPGAGWRGYDPTLGLAVSDRHIALSASAWPAYTAPISGSFRGEGECTQVKYHLAIEPEA